MLVSSSCGNGSDSSPEAPCVDAARDSQYCPQDAPKIHPRAAPRGNPPTPKPRSG